MLTLSCSGTGAAEAAITNTLSAGDAVLVLVNGRFSKRWSEMLRTFGADVTELNFEWGRHIDIARVAETLRNKGAYKAVWLTHSETSTGVLNELRELARVVHELSDALVCADAVSSLGAHELLFDDWMLDVVIAAPQKALASSPGLGFVALSQRAWNFASASRLPKFYFDLERARRELENGTTPWTPAIQEIQAQLAVTERILTEGLENYRERHRLVSLTVKKHITNLGLKIFGPGDFERDERLYSRTVTAVETNRAAEILSRMKSEFGVEFAAGQDHLNNRIFRFGHAGFVEAEDLDYVFRSLSSVLTT